MKVYWATFAGLKDFHPLKLGIGVIARDDADARKLISDAFGDAGMPELSAVNHVDVLDPRQVRPNMGNIFLRGIWFPLGHEATGTPKGR